MWCVAALVNLFVLASSICSVNAQVVKKTSSALRNRVSLNYSWKFMRYSSSPDRLMYDDRPKVSNRNDNVVADTRPSETAVALSTDSVLKKWILPTANNFILDTSKHYKRPPGNPGGDFPFVQKNYNDQAWENVTLPHDWAARGPFYEGAKAEVGGGMGRLPIQGIAWYRRTLKIPAAAVGKTIYLEVDGAMSYAIVWLNGKLVGGWPYGYNSFHLDITPFVKFGEENQLAIRIDNPNHSARWYPGAGLYRDVWLSTVPQAHVAQWGTFVCTKNVSASSATVDLTVQLENKSHTTRHLNVVTEIYLLNERLRKTVNAIAVFPTGMATIQPGKKASIDNSVNVKNPKLWGPPPTQKATLYVAVTKLFENGKQVDEYETRFGIRSITIDPVKGVLVNGQKIRIQGVNQHHDLGALGSAFNKRAAERQLEILREMGCNAIRLAHNPPAPELLQLTDSMGFLVIDEIFDNWERGKTPLDFHLIFNDWYEADIRSFIRRDRNHPSVFVWSFGNEVGEQYTGEQGAALAKKLYDILKQEDATRPATASMNYAKPDMPLPSVMDMISLNYQGEGIRDAPAYAHLQGIRTSPLYPAFHNRFPDKLILSSESASALSSRGTYIFPVVKTISAPVSDTTGGDPKSQQVSAYELYTAPFGASADKVFATQDQHPYVAGEFVWSGWDYLGEPTPYYTARSSYSGIIDLAGFKKDRFYLYQSRWRPDLKMAHILPHWNWQNRLGQITPVHVFSSGDEAELFLNGKSLGRRKKGKYEYRFRWDSVVYMPGDLRVVTYKNAKVWAKHTVKTCGDAKQLQITADRNRIEADGQDLSFLTVRVLDNNGLFVASATNLIKFEISGPGEIVATDNGDPSDLVAFPSPDRKAYSGLALVIIKGKAGLRGPITVTAKSPGLNASKTVVYAQ